MAWDIAVDAAGNSFVTGLFAGTHVDFDPGPGVFNLTALSAVFNKRDGFVVKFDAAGTFVWANRIGGDGSDGGQGIAVDAAGNSYVTGHFQGPADFDPGPGSVILTSAGSQDIFVAKYDPVGNLSWALSAGSNFEDDGQSIAADAEGSSYVTGRFWNTADFDPGPEVFELTSVGNRDIFVARYDPDNTPPTADAGDDQTVECADPNGTSIMLDGTGSSDPDDDDLTFSWTGSFGTEIGPTPTVTLPLGTHIITLTVDDGNDETDTDEVEILVEDTNAPGITVATEPITLWPPNHKYHTINLGDFVTGAGDSCDGDVSTASVSVASVVSDEEEDATSGGDSDPRRRH